MCPVVPGVGLPDPRHRSCTSGVSSTGMFTRRLQTPPALSLGEQSTDGLQLLGTVRTLRYAERVAERDTLRNLFQV